MDLYNSKNKADFIEQRTFFEKLCDARTLLNRKNYLQDKPLLEETTVHDFSKIKVIMDDLQDNGFIEDWTIGGGTAVMYYANAIPSIDVDIFAHYTSTSFLAPLSEVYEYLIDKYKAKVEKEMIKIGSLYLQFLPADSNNPVDTEATKHPNIIKGGLRLFEFEYLICSMLYVGSKKYIPRLSLIKSEELYDEKKLIRLLKKFGLEKEWEDVN